MDAILVRECGCEVCGCKGETAVVAEHRRINVLLSRMDEQQRRWLVAHESIRIGYGGDVQMSRITGLNVDTIASGRKELSRDWEGRPMDRVRLPGAGRPPAEKRSDVDRGSEAGGRTRDRRIAHGRTDEVGSPQSAKSRRAVGETSLSQPVAAAVAEGGL